MSEKLRKKVGYEFDDVMNLGQNIDLTDEEFSQWVHIDDDVHFVKPDEVSDDTLLGNIVESLCEKEQPEQEPESESEEEEPEPTPPPTIPEMRNMNIMAKMREGLQSRGFDMNGFAFFFF